MVITEFIFILCGNQPSRAFEAVAAFFVQTAEFSTNARTSAYSMMGCVP